MNVKVCGCLSLCVRPVLDWKPVQGAPRFLTADGIRAGCSFQACKAKGMPKYSLFIGVPAVAPLVAAVTDFQYRRK